MNNSYSQNNETYLHCNCSLLKTRVRYYIDFLFLEKSALACSDMYCTKNKRARVFMSIKKWNVQENV